MNRDFTNFNHWLNVLLGDDYGQPPDAGHTAMIAEVGEGWISKMSTCKSVLDVGCGATAVADAIFIPRGIKYTGITLDKDAEIAQSMKKNVLKMDMSFMDFPDESFDLVWCRHTLEHSPFPLLTLFEFYRVSRAWLCVIVPSPIHYGRTGLNHYSVLYPDQWEFLMERAGWNIMWRDFSNDTEYRFMAEKKREKYEFKN